MTDVRWPRARHPGAQAVSAAALHDAWVGLWPVLYEPAPLSGARQQRATAEADQRVEGVVVGDRESRSLQGPDVSAIALNR